MNNVKFLDKHYNIDTVTLQTELIANNLIFLLRHSGVSRSELAKRLNWKKSRVSRVLSGDVNLTLKTISAISDELGYAFDIVFYNQNYPKPKQPWKIDKENMTIAVQSTELKSQPIINIQSDDQVFNDLIKGDGASFYISVKNKRTINVNTSQLTKTIPHSINPHFISTSAQSTELPVSKFKSIKVMNHE